MTDLTKWEFITYGDIKKGDKLKVIITGEKANLVTKTKTVATVDREGWAAWYASDVNVISNGENSDEDFTVEIYRRKPKAFKLPKGLGAVIAATFKDTSLARNTGEQRYIRAGHDLWIPENDNCGSNDNDWMLTKYRDHRVISTGSKD